MVKLNYRDYGNISYLAGTAILGGLIGYTIYAKYKGITFKPPKPLYPLSLALMMIGFATKVKAISNGDEKIKMGGLYSIGLGLISLAYVGEIVNGKELRPILMGNEV